MPAFNLFSLMTAHNRQGLGFKTEEEHFSHVTEVAQYVGLLSPPHYAVVLLLC